MLLGRQGKEEAEEWIETNRDQTTGLTASSEEDKRGKGEKDQELEVSDNTHLHSSLHVREARIAELEKELADINVNQVVEKPALVDL